MSKYDPLGDYLSKQAKESIPMTFVEIERLLHLELPPSKSHRAWWSNNPSNNVMTKQWLNAGYETEQVDVEAGRLVFRRVAGPKKRADQPKGSVFGCLKGMVKVSPGTDLTAPTGDDWETETGSGFHESRGNL
jgi:hypothetical protein